MAYDRRRCLEAGMDEYLTKPIKRDALCLALARLAPAPGTRSALQPETAAP